MSIDRSSKKGQGEGFALCLRGPWIFGRGESGRMPGELTRWRTATAQCLGLWEERSMVKGWRKQELSWELC